VAHPQQYEEIPSHNGRWLVGTWIFSRRTPVARKRHLCDRCGQYIEAKQRYVVFVTTNQEGPGWERWKLHGECYLDRAGAMFDGIRPDWRWEG
jgi:hypothetical protein